METVVLRSCVLYTLECKNYDITEPAPTSLTPPPPSTHMPTITCIFETDFDFGLEVFPPFALSPQRPTLLLLLPPLRFLHCSWEQDPPKDKDYRHRTPSCRSWSLFQQTPLPACAARPSSPKTTGTSEEDRASERNDGTKKQRSENA